jgi:methylthioribose-1-phosphate isomerase
VRVGGRVFRTIWLDNEGASVQIIDQARLPHEFEIVSITTVSEAARAIKDMQVRGAPLIGVTTAYGLALAMREEPSDANLETACAALGAARPTAVNLQWALEAMRRHLLTLPPAERGRAGFAYADAIAEQDVGLCQAIGAHGVGLIRAAATRKPLNRLLTLPASKTLESIFLPIAMRDGWRRWTGAPPWHQSTRRMTKGLPCMCGSTKRGRAIKARR